MGNQPSSDNEDSVDSPRNSSSLSKQQFKDRDDKEKYKSFPGSAILEKTFCGSIDTTDPAEYEDVNLANRLLKKADIMCISSPEEHKEEVFFDPSELDQPKHKASAMLARALVSEVTDNPKTMKQAEMAAREKQLLKAQQAAHSRRASVNPDNKNGEDESRPVGAPGGVGAPSVLSSLAFAVTGDETAGNVCVNPKDVSSNSSMMAPGPLQENRAAAYGSDDELMEPLGPFAVTIGLSLSRRHSAVGHPDTVTRQTAFDFNELQDRNYKYVSSTDPTGWRAGGGEKGGSSSGGGSSNHDAAFEEGISTLHAQDGPASPNAQKPSGTQHDKMPSPDVVHIPIIHINCGSNEQVDQIIHSLASGEIFIPHMAVLPEALSVNGISPPDLVVRFDCERNEDMPPDEWPNWCLEFMHNQLYEYFYSIGARWMKRPFSITLARKVKWKTVKHMNRYFAHAEQVIQRWRDNGPQLLDPQLSYIEGGATPEEVAHPHGIYLMRKGVATNYFAPNFDPPYTTKMTRSLLENVLNKSWDKKRHEWSSEPIPKLVTPNLLLAMACGCTDPTAEGFMAREVTAAAVRRSVQDVTSSGSNQLVERATQQHTEMLQTNNSSGSNRHRDHHEPYHRSSHQQQHQQQQQRSMSPQEPELEEEEEEEDNGGDEEEDEIVQDETNDYTEEAYGEDDDMESDQEDEDEEPASPVPQVETVTSETTDGEDDQPSLSEEKKTEDETSEMSGDSKPSKGRRQKTWAKASSNITDASLAMSGTTVMHANVTKGSQRRFAEDDWAQPVKPDGNSGDQPTRWSKSKKLRDKQSAKEMLEQERKLQEQLLRKVQSGESNSSSKKGDNKSSHYTMTPVTPVTPNKRGSTEIDPSDSGVSMEYSHDGSSAFMTDGGSMLLGQHFAGDNSVSLNTPRTQRSTGGTEDDDEEESALMSVQASSSSLSVVPTDEELLAIGWAKAMDASSGNYYYYTLDRKQTVWENPLSSNQSTDDSKKMDP